MNVLVIDSNYFCYKAYYAVGGLAYEGVETGIYYGFFNQLITAARMTKPDNIIFCWDSRQSERKKIFPEYKKKVEQTEEEKEMWGKVFKKFRYLQKKILPELGFNNIFIQRGYESDDLIAKYVLNRPKGHIVYIASGDNDLLQLLDDRCFIIKDNTFYGKQDFINDTQLSSPRDWIEVKKIAGCTSDKVPGVPDVKEKRAIQYLLGQMNPKTKTYKKIKEHKELILFNEKLVLLPFKKTIDINGNITKNAFSMKQFLRMCREYGFHSFRTEERKEEIRNLFN